MHICKWSSGWAICLAVKAHFMCWLARTRWFILLLNSFPFPTPPSSKSLLISADYTVGIAVLGHLRLQLWLHCILVKQRKQSAMASALSQCANCPKQANALTFVAAAIAQVLCSVVHPLFTIGICECQQLKGDRRGAWANVDRYWESDRFDHICICRCKCTSQLARLI